MTDDLPQSATVWDEPQDAATILLPEQVRCLELLLKGCSITETAREIGVHRCTVHRWFDKDHVFSGAYDRLRNELVEAARNRLLGLAHDAVDVVHAAIRAGDAGVAVKMLSALGAMAPVPAPRRLDEIAELVSMIARDTGR